MYVQRASIISFLVILISADELAQPPWLMSLPFTPWPTLQNYSQLNQEAFRYVVRKEMKKIAMDKSSDGESVDALEHFFWG